MNELKVVRAAVYLCRSLRKHPSRRLIDNLIRTVNGRSIRGTHLDALIAQVASEPENGTVPNTTGLPYASSGTVRDTTGRTRENKNKTIETDTLPSVASNTKSILSEKSAKPKSVKPTIAPVDFGVAIEPLIGIFVANLAAQNKTGRVLDTRIAAMRAELHVAMLAHNHPSSFASGLAVANRAGIANVNYVLRVAETERNQAPKFALTAVAPIEYAGYVRTADAMWHPFRGTKRVVGWADGLPPGLLPERFSETPWSEAVAAKAQQTADEMAESA